MVHRISFFGLTPLVVVSSSLLLLEAFAEKTCDSKTEVCSADETLSGGWRSIPDGFTAGCPGIDRMHISELTEEVFNKTYFRKKPLIITGVLEGEDGQQLLKDWSRSNVEKTLNKKEVQIGYSRELVSLNQGRGNKKLSMKKYLQKLDKLALQPPENRTRDPRYLFDKDNLLKDPALSETRNKMMRVFGSTLGKNLEDKDMWSVLVGTSNASVQWHRHSDAYNLILYGLKRWWLYPPATAPPVHFPAFFPVYIWFEDVYPTIEESRRPIECQQNPGELIYLPSGWYHMTQCQGECVALARKSTNYEDEFGPVDKIINDTEWEEFAKNASGRGSGRFNTFLAFAYVKRYMKEGRWNESALLLDEIIDADPINQVALQSAGVNAFIQGNLTKAEDYFQLMLKNRSDRTQSPVAWEGIGMCLLGRALKMEKTMVHNMMNMRMNATINDTDGSVLRVPEAQERAAYLKAEHKYYLKQAAKRKSRFPGCCVSVKFGPEVIADELNADAWKWMFNEPSNESFMLAYMV
eukprot:TRINITY_DN6923_c0_g1_i3.p1 TRINITY_DN6923_c0_g1~~TRINITY_DN6923_c0_g1_i3.p1  ORF type:complete len:522 (-),score=60.30 TRINITY_DN6923_c0_g1_i3:123-1688(-)